MQRTPQSSVESFFTAVVSQTLTRMKHRRWKWNACTCLLYPYPSPSLFTVKLCEMRAVGVREACPSFPVPIWVGVGSSISTIAVQDLYPKTALVPIYCQHILKGFFYIEIPVVEQVVVVLDKIGSYLVGLKNHAYCFAYQNVQK